MNRRSFLQTSAAALGAVAVGLGDDRPAKREIHKGVMLGTVGGELGKLSLKDRFKAIADAGFEGAEAMSHAPRDEVAAAYQSSGLKCPSVCGSLHWDKVLTSNDAKVRREGVDALKHTIEDARTWGARSILLVPGTCTPETPYDVAIERAYAGISEALPLAEEAKVRISIENVWNNMFLSPVEAAAFVDRFHSPWVGWHFDVGNVIVYGWPEQWIRILGHRINTLHIKEYSRQKADKQGRWAGFDVEFLKGDNNWPAVMAALDAIGYHHWGIAEQGGAGSVDGLKKLSAEMDTIFAS
jgi:L-ribulose-5-phosphate 3-epimerase